MYLYRLGEALLKRTEPLIEGVPTKRISEIVQLGELHHDEQDEKGLFCPLIQYNGSRSFMPCDLEDAEEIPVRKLAEACHDPIVKARIYEVLFARFPKGRGAYQPQIVAARLASLPLLDGWPQLLDAIVRASVLAIRAKDESQLRAALEGWELAGSTVLCGEFWWAFVIVATAFARIVLKQRWARQFVEETRLQRWDCSVRWVAHAALQIPHFQRQRVLEETGNWCGLIGAGADKTRYHRDHVQDVMAEAEEIGGLVATSHLSRAMKLATDRGFSDLLVEAKRAFPAAAAAGEAEFKSYSGTLQIPRPILDAIDEMIERSPETPTLLRGLAGLPLLMLLPMEDVRASAEKSLSGSVARALTTSVTHRDRKITSISSSKEEKLREEIAMVTGVRLSINEAILRRVLRRVFASTRPMDLFEVVRECPGLEGTRVPLLARASERFHAEDWISSGTITSVMYEAVLRDFIRWTGYPARSVGADGIHADQTLGDMLRSDEVRHVLGREHTDMVAHVLVDPAHGINLRNDVGHGTVREQTLSPERILLVWLFMARLALIRPITDEECGDSTAPRPSEDSDATQAEPTDADIPATD